MNRGGKRYPSLAEYAREHTLLVEKSVQQLERSVAEVGKALVAALRGGHKVLAFGNGGSAAEASHFAAELMGRFSKTPRRSLPAIALACDPGVLTSIGNDFGYGTLFERQIEALAEPGDIALALTTSGKSENVLRGLTMARKKRAVTIALTGEAGVAGARPHYLLDVPSASTNHVQEVHLAFLHVWCASIDKEFARRQQSQV
jgi:D-sedoheptulose 7-phosphate isomerase